MKPRAAKARTAETHLRMPVSGEPAVTLGPCKKVVPTLDCFELSIIGLLSLSLAFNRVSSGIVGAPMKEAREDEALLELVCVSRTYADGDVKALQEVSLRLDDGEFVSIVGPSGCGKSTLLNMLGGLDRPSNGSVRFKGNSLGQINLDQYRSSEIGFVFQSFYLLPNLNAIENVQLPMFGSELGPAARIDRARELIKLVGLDTREKHLPNQLSIGQRQRVAIARSLANSPSVILADEPTGSLDSQSGAEVMELLGNLNRELNTTLVIVTHDMKVAEAAKRMIRMLDGEIVEDTSRATNLS